MAASYHIEKELGVVFTSGSGTFGFADAVDHMNRLKKDPDFNPSFSQLLDYREVTEISLTHDQIVELASVQIFSAEAKRAFLVATPEHYGLARVFQNYRAVTGDKSIRVFMDAGEAFAWLGIEKHATP